MVCALELSGSRGRHGRACWSMLSLRLPFASTVGKGNPTRNRVCGLFQPEETIFGTTEASLLASKVFFKYNETLLFQACPEMVTGTGSSDPRRSHKTSGGEGCFFRCTCRAASPSD